MGGKDSPPRRTILAALGGAAATIPTVQAGDHRTDDDHPNYTNWDEPPDRPYAREGSARLTAHDCSHVTVEPGSDEPSAVEIEVRVSYHGGTRHEVVEFEDPDFPLEFIANCHLDELDPAYGSAIIWEVVCHFGPNRRLTFYMPTGAWECDKVRQQEVDSRVLEEYCTEEYEAAVSDGDW